MQFEPSTGLGAIDVGPEVLMRLRSALSVEADWTVDTERSFTWYPGALALHATADPPRRDCGFDVVRVRVETTLLTRVASRAAATRAISDLNCGATLAAARVDRNEIRVASAMYLHSETAEWGAALLAHAAVLQLASADEMLSILSRHVRARRRSARHPRRGRRRDAVTMLGRTSAMAAESYARGPIAAEEFEALPEALDSMVAAMRLQPEAAVVEIPYSGTEPSWIDRVNVMKDDPALMEDDAVIPGFEDFPETALLMVDGSAVHPVLGPGCLLHLVLPLHDPGGRCLAKVAAREWTSFARCHTIGGWYDRDGTPAHVAFVPSVAFYPGMLVSLVWNEIVRTGFARSVI